MTKDEALDLALAALECFDYPAHDDDVNKIQAAITAIKQARALDKKAENARELGLDYEPVGLIDRLINPEQHYEFTDPKKANAVLMSLCQEAADALAAPVQEPVAWLYPEGLEALKAGKCWTAYGTKQDDNCNIPVHLNAAVAPKVEPVKTECDGFDSHPAAQPAPVQPVPWSQALESVWAEPDDTPPAAQPAPVQEPVAWMFQHDETGRMNYVGNDGIHNPTMFLEMNPRYALVCPLYTTPPAAQRQWVGLTARDWNVIGFTAEFRAGAEWANDKLKEKNT